MTAAGLCTNDIYVLQFESATQARWHCLLLPADPSPCPRMGHVMGYIHDRCGNQGVENVLVSIHASSVHSRPSFMRACCKVV